MKATPQQVVTEISNAATDRLLTVGTVDESQQDLVAESNLTFDGSTLTVTGDLVVTGNTTTATNTQTSDKLIELANGTTGTPSGDAGIIIERGDSTNAGIIWDESRDEFVVCTTSATASSSGDLTFTPANLSVERVGAGTEQAEAEVHAKRDASSGGTYSTTATVISEDDARPAIQLVGSANNIGMIQFGDNAAAAAGQVYYDHSTDKLRIDCGASTDRLTVDASGNVDAAGVVTATGFTIGSAAITETELEILDGATLSTTELNYVDGVTSAIQTQLDAKQATISAGSLLDLSGATVNVDLTEAGAATIAAGDHVLFLDGGATGTHAKGSIDDVATLFAGSAATTGLSASSGVLSVSDLHPVGVSGSANQLITDDGDGTVTSQSNLSFDGSTLAVTGAASTTTTMSVGTDLVVTGGDLQFGNGQNASVTVAATAGTDAAGRTLVLAAGQGTGTGAGGSIVFQTADGGGSSNSSANSLATALTLNDDQTATFAGVVTAAGFTVGSAAISETELEILDGATVTTTELNLLDGGTSVGSSITVADTDGFIVNDGGTMKTIPASDVKTYAGGGGAAADDSNLVLHMQAFA